MQEKKTKILHLVYGIVLSVLIFAVGVCFIVSCIDINNSSEKFTVDSIRIHFLWILAPTLLCLALIIGGAILHAIFPPYEGKIGASMTDKDILKNLYKRIDVKAAPEELQRVIKSQRGFRCAFFVIMMVNAVINFVSALVFIFTKSGLDPVNEGNLSIMLPILFKILAYAIIPFFIAIIYDIFSKFTYEKELEAVRIIMEKQAKKHKYSEINSPKEKKICFFRRHEKILILIAQILVVSIASLLIIIGIFTGDLKKVATLANDICRGCIGLG